MKKALITGCNVGIGYAILNEFLKQKYSVVACFRKKNLKNRKLVSGLKKKHKNKVFDYYFDLEEQNQVVNQIKNISSLNKIIIKIISHALKLATLTRKYKSCHFVLIYLKLLI